MRTKAVLLHVALLALVGCTGSKAPVATTSDNSEATAVAAESGNTSSGATLISLKVPNMH